MSDLPDNVLQFPGPGRRHIDEELARGRRPLYVDRDSGRISGSPHTPAPDGSRPRRPGDGDFGERLARIRMSIAKCNELMAELRASAQPEIARPGAPGEETSGE